MRTDRKKHLVGKAFDWFHADLTGRQFFVG